MHFVFSSLTCSYQEYRFIQKIKFREKMNPSQKYFDMFLNGLILNDCGSISCISARAIAHSNCKTKYLKYKKELLENISYFYIPIINLFIIRNIFNFLFGFLFTAKDFFKRKEKVIFIADPLAYDVSLGGMIAAKIFRKKTCAIITDLPIYMEEINKDGKGISLKKRIGIFLMNTLINTFDCYVFLTESMNVLNKMKKKYAIIEGMTYSNTKQESKHFVENNTVLYAGGLHEQFGIKTLVNAAKNIKVPGFELHLYGEGNCVDFIKDTTKTFPNIKYMGSLSLEEIIKVEQNAKILINPRPSSEKFTEFSFPSKTIEYMSAGRPVLTTPLKGIPKEYYDYLYIISDESEQGIAESIEKCLREKNEILDNFGYRGAKFVYEEKNSKKTISKFLKMIQSDDN